MLALPDDSRPIALAVAASLVLHALVLFALRFPHLKESLSFAPPHVLIARLMSLAPAAEPPAAPVPRPAPAPPPHRKPKLARPILTAPLERPAAAPAPAAAEPAKSEPVPAPEPALSSAAPAPAAPAPSSAPAAPDPQSVARYRQQLIGAAARYKRYPARAVDEGWEGSVVLEATFDRAGRPGLRVKSSSGHGVLDEQALAMFRSALPQVPLPPTLLGQTFEIDLRAVYSLKD